MMTIAAELTLRAYRGPEDAATVAGVVNAESRADGIPDFWTTEGTAAWFGHATAQFDARRDVVIGELEGVPVAAGGVDWVDTRDGQYREFRFWGSVHPEYRGRGIGTRLLAHLEGHARALAEAMSDLDRPAALGSFAAVGRPEEAFLRAAGYEPARWFFEMVRPTLDAVEAEPMPDGLELRPVTPDQHETIWRANREAFRDHWGGSDESLGAMRRVLDGPDTDTGLWLIAWDGAEVAGGIWNEINATQNRELGLQRGWLASVFTRRPWRRRGLAQALIGRSLLLLRERGMTSAALGVDADNPSGALGLYEAAGFEIDERFIAMRRPMEADTP